MEQRVVPILVMCCELNRKWGYKMINAVKLPQCVIRGAAILSMLAGSAQAGQVFKCVNANGTISFQATECADNDIQTEVVIRKDAVAQPPVLMKGAALPSAKPLSQNAPAIGSQTRGSTSSEPTNPDASTTAKPPANTVSYECSAEKGIVFYRHKWCPSSLPGKDQQCAPPRHCVNSTEIPVTSRQISRDEACSEINRAGAIGRRGHELDEVPSTYDKNLRRDPCR